MPKRSPKSRSKTLRDKGHLRGAAVKEDGRGPLQPAVDGAAGPKELNKSERRLSSILDSITDCHFELDEVWRFIRVNKHCFDYFGKEREDLIGRSYFEVFPTLRGSVFRDQYDRAVTEHTSVHFDVKSILYPGRWVELHVYPTEGGGVLVFFRDITERKKAEEALRESEARLRAVLDGSPDAIFVKDRESRLLLANPATLAIIGKPAEACLGKTDEEFYDNPADGRAIMANDRLIMASGCTETVEETLNTPSGPRHYLSTKAPYRNAAGEIVGLIGVARDITERKKADEAVQAQRNLLETVVNHIPASVNLIRGSDLRLQLVNSAYRAIAPGKSMVGRTLDELWPETGRDFSALCRRVLETGEPYHVEDELNMIRRRSEGPLEPAYFSWSLHRVRLPGDEGWGLLNTAWETTDRKRLEEDLSRRQVELQSLFNNSNAGLVLFDAKPPYTVLTHNRYYQELFPEPFRTQGMVGKSIYEYAPEVEAGGVAAVFDEVRRTGQAVDLLDFRYDSHPPAKSWFNWHLSPVIHDGEVVALASMSINITSQHLAEEALRKAHDELELRVQERTAELTRAYDKLMEETRERAKLEEQLRQAQKMEAIGTLAGGIAHDFNNILAAIIGFAEMVEEDLLPGNPSRPRIQRVLSAACRGRDLVRQILAFSRKAELTRTPLAVSPIVEETAQLLRASLPSTININLSTKAAKDTVLASPTEIQQMLMNLATNASFAMGEKGGIMGIRVTNINFEPDSPVLDEDVEPGEYVQITVTDTGTGMTPEVMKRAFDPFFTTKEVGKGTGMGLAVVYGIVKSLSGTIAVESEPGTGSTFRIFLPVARTDEMPEGGKALATPQGAERILFVDDEELLMEWGQAALERLGYRVTALTDSTRALDLFFSDPMAFDLVIMDQTMPVLTGLNLSRKLLEIRNDVPIILCTGYSDSVSPEKAREAGIKEFLMKPLGKEQLAEVVRRVLDAKDG